MSLDIKREYNETEDRWDVALSGEVDIENAACLRAVLKEMMEQRLSSVEIDIQNLSYIDSTGLGVMIGAYGRMKESGVQLRLRHPAKNVEKLLRITSLDRIFL